MRLTMTGDDKINVLNDSEILNDKRKTISNKDNMRLTISGNDKIKVINEDTIDFTSEIKRNFTNNDTIIQKIISSCDKTDHFGVEKVEIKNIESIDSLLNEINEGTYDLSNLSSPTRKFYKLTPPHQKNKSINKSKIENSVLIQKPTENGFKIEETPAKDYYLSEKTKTKLKRKKINDSFTSSFQNTNTSLFTEEINEIEMYKNEIKTVEEFMNKLDINFDDEILSNTKRITLIESKLKERIEIKNKDELNVEIIQKLINNNIQKKKFEMIESLNNKINERNEKNKKEIKEYEDRMNYLKPKIFNEYKKFEEIKKIKDLKIFESKNNILQEKLKIEGKMIEYIQNEMNIFQNNLKKEEKKNEILNKKIKSLENEFNIMKNEPSNTEIINDINELKNELKNEKDYYKMIKTEYDQSNFFSKSENNLCVEKLLFNTCSNDFYLFRLDKNFKIFKNDENFLKLIMNIENNEVKKIEIIDLFEYYENQTYSKIRKYYFSKLNLENEIKTQFNDKTELFKFFFTLNYKLNKLKYFMNEIESIQNKSILTQFKDDQISFVFFNLKTYKKFQLNVFLNNVEEYPFKNFHYEINVLNSGLNNIEMMEKIKKFDKKIEKISKICLELKKFTN
jgi:hypothetical protein